MIVEVIVVKVGRQTGWGRETGVGGGLHVACLQAGSSVNGWSLGWSMRTSSVEGQSRSVTVKGQATALCSRYVASKG